MASMGSINDPSKFKRQVTRLREQFMNGQRVTVTGTGAQRGTINREDDSLKTDSDSSESQS